MSELKAETVVPQGTSITLQMYGKGEVDAAIAELKDENRRLKRALWMARAERALSEQHVISNAVLYLENKFNHKFNSVRHELHVWGVVKRKCRAKAKEYK